MATPIDLLEFLLVCYVVSSYLTVILWIVLENEENASALYELLTFVLAPVVVYYTAVGWVLEKVTGYDEKLEDATDG